jgi:DNA topoisomerase-3
MSSMTNEGIAEAFKHLRSAEQMQGLADAARCRSESDWLIGINGTRALTKRMFGSRAGNVASVGRVQTPTLAIVYNRELEIRNFKPRGYWRLTAKFGVAKGDYEGSYQRPDFKKNDDEHDRIDRIWDKAKAEAILAACSGQPVASVTEEKKASTSAPPRLYDLTTLQREANSRFGFPAKRTLQIAQALYERHKMITYPRTDSRALPEDYIPLVRQTLGNLHGDLKQHAERVLESGWVQPNKRIFNNAQVSDHFAIIPTQHEAKNLDEAEAKLFDMIARRFVATFHPVAEFDITTRISTVATHAFKTEGKVLTAPGWLAVYGKTTDDESADAKALPALAPEDKLKARTLEAKLHEESTRPPPRYSEATLLSAMEGAGKLVDDEELAEAMKERGLGTPATRADTIEGLINQKYLDRAQRELVPTTKAEQLFQFLGAVKIENLTSPGHDRRVGVPSPRDGAQQILPREVHGRNRQGDEGHRGAREGLRGGRLRRPRDRHHLPDRQQADEGDPPRLQVAGWRADGLQDRRRPPHGGGRGQAARRDEAGRPARRLHLQQDPQPVLGRAEAGDRRGDEEGQGHQGERHHQEVEDRLRLRRQGGHRHADARSGPTRRRARRCAKAAAAIIVREKKPDGAWEQTFRVGRIMCQKQIPAEQAIKLIGEGKTDLIENFISKKGRPFSAFLKRDGGKFSWEFPPRAPKLDKDGNPIVRKAKAKADLSKATVLGESKTHTGGQLVELGDAYYVRKPDQDNRQVFKLSKKLCEIDIPVEQVKKLIEDGRSDLIEGFVSKRGNKFSAYLVMSQKQDKAEFEFPPR